MEHRKLSAEAYSQRTTLHLKLMVAKAVRHRSNFKLLFADYTFPRPADLYLFGIIAMEETLASVLVNNLRFPVLQFLLVTSTWYLTFREASY